LDDRLVLGGRSLGANISGVGLRTKKLASQRIGLRTLMPELEWEIDADSVFLPWEAIPTGRSWQANEVLRGDRGALSHDQTPVFAGKVASGVHVDKRSGA